MLDWTARARCTRLIGSHAKQTQGNDEMMKVVLKETGQVIGWTNATTAVDGVPLPLELKVRAYRTARGLLAWEPDPPPNPPHPVLIAYNLDQDQEGDLCMFIDKEYEFPVSVGSKFSAYILWMHLNGAARLQRLLDDLF